MRCIALKFVLCRPVIWVYSVYFSRVGSAYLKQDMTQRAGVSKSSGGVCVRGRGLRLKVQD